MATAQQQAASKKSSKEKDQEFAARLRLNEQAALMLNIDNLLDKEAELTGGKKIKRREKSYNNFSVFREGTGHIDITRRIYRNESIKNLLKNVPSSVISSLLPSIKLYKIFYPSIASDKNKSYSWRVPFDDIPVQNNPNTSKFQEGSIEEILAGNGRMHGVGIKSFNYKYAGTNPAESSTLINADLELYFQNITDLVKQIDISSNELLPTPTESNLNFKFMYADLAVDSPMNERDRTTKRLTYNSNYFRIKAVVGYAEPSEKFLRGIVGDNYESVKRAINTAKVIFYLTPYKHDINFEENGSVTLKINYNASMATTMYELDCLAITDSHDKLRKVKESYEQEVYDKQAKISQIQNNCDKKTEKQRENEIKSKEKEYLEKINTIQNEIENSKNKVYSEVFRRLIGLTKQTKDTYIYSALFNKNALGIINNQVEEDSAQARIMNLNNSRGIQKYKIDSITDEDKKFLSLSQVPPDIKAPKNSNPQKPPDDKVETARNIQEKRANQNLKTNIKEEIPGFTRIKFVFLGDLMDIFLSALNSQKDPTVRPRLIFTDFIVEIPVASNIQNGKKAIFDINQIEYKEVNLNLADIPISINMLQNFFIEKIVKPRRDIFMLNELITSILTDIVIPSVSPSVFGKKTVLNNAVRMSTLNITVPFTGEQDSFTGKNKKDNFGDIIQSDKLDKNLSNLFYEADVRDCGNYLIFYCSNQAPTGITKNKITVEDPTSWIEQDEKNGVYHLSIGTDSSFIKSMTFSKVDMPFAKEARFSSESGDKTIARFREVYNVDVRMFGNNIYRPGDFLYIEPLFINNKQAVDIQNKLGLGGYYMVVESSTNISDNNFETSLKTVFQASVENGKIIGIMDSRSKC